MIAPLTPHLPFADDETPLSWAVRLAAFHSGDAVRGFLTDHGIRLADVKQGTSDAVRRLAELGGADPDRVLRNATVADGDHWLFRGEPFIARLINRRPGHVCPLCLVEDTGSTTVPDKARLRERFAWRFDAVSACPAHGVALIDVLQSERLGTHDTLTDAVADRWDMVARAAAAPSPREPSPLQGYLLGRLDGVAGPPWLDGQRLDQAIRSIELIGTVMIGGPRPGRRTFDSDAIERARTIGFEIAAGGPEAIRKALSALQRRDEAQSGNAGPAAVFGRLHAWAEHPSNHQAPLAQLLRAHIIETMPIGAGDTLFGAPVAERRVHSVRTLGQSRGLDVQRLRKVLANAGVISAEMLALDDNRCVFDAAKGEAVAEMLVGSMTLKGLATALHITLPRAGAIVETGLLRPAVAADAGRGLGAFAFSGREVDAFVSALFDGAEAVAAASPGFVTVDIAARAAGGPVVAILGAVLGGRLPTRQRVAGAPGITGLRVQQDEVAALFPPEPLAGYRLLAEAADWLGVPYASMAFLLRQRQGGALIATERVQHSRRGLIRAIPEAALAAFDVRYVTPRKLARELGIAGASLTLQIDKLDLSPAFDPALAKTRIYVRDSLEGAIASLTLKRLKPSGGSRSARDAA